MSVVAVSLKKKEHVYFGTTASSIDNIRVGKRGAIAVTKAMCSETLNDIPTVAEFVPGYEVFFFQAKDGIRDGTVTGVQTCALPISRGSGAGLVCRRRLTGTTQCVRAIPI